MTLSLFDGSPRTTVAATPSVVPGGRLPRPDDAEALATLMYDAYRGTVDDAGETREDTRSEVEKLVRGDFGAFDVPASLVVERGGRLASATIVTRDRTRYATGDAFVAFSMTAPEWKRHGLARLGLLHVIALLRARGEPRVHLLVTCANIPAVRLYESLGFVMMMRK